MFLLNRNRAFAPMMAILVLAACTDVGSFSVFAGQKEERPQAKPARAAGTVDAAPPRPIARPRRTFQIDLTIVEKQDGRRTVLSVPRLLAREGKTASFTAGDSRTIQLGSGMTEEVVMGPTVRLVIRSDQGGKVRLDLSVRRPIPRQISLGVSRPSQGAHEDVILVETATLRLLRTMTLGESINFELNDKTSPKLEVTAKVREVGKEAKRKTIALVGQIFITGNKKISDEVILKQVPLFPGQILTFPDLQIAEQNLSRIKGLKGRPKVTVIDREGGGEYKDIQITVEEK